MTQVTESGTLGNLTSEQEVKLQQAWIHLLRLCGTELASLTDKHPDMSSQFLQHLNDKIQPATEFQHSLWRFIVNDHPDATVLRFLRARKWDVEAAMEMLVSAVNWREETNIDEKIVWTGEGVALKTPPSKTENEFLDQWRSGKSYARGSDRENRPIYVVRVKLHDPKTQGPEAMETYILHSIESLRLLARAPNDRACLLFDLTGFGLKNMDYHVVKFLIQVFESRYPETLGAVLVYNAPFVFWGIWNVVKRWLDPVVAAKINFAKNASDLAKFVQEENLQKCYGGTDTWEYKYVEPIEGENAHLASAEKRAELQTERQQLARQYEQLTADWVALSPESEEGKAKDIERKTLAETLEKSYWSLDPYIRARTYYHRTGVLNAHTGGVNFKASK